MSIRALCFSVAALAFVASAGFAADYQSGRPAVETGVYHRHEGRLRLPKELKMMWRQEERSHLRSLPKEQRRGWIKAHWAAMTDEQKQAKIAELQAKWDALPASVRQALLQKKQQRREAKLMKKTQRSQSSQTERY